MEDAARDGASLDVTCEELQLVLQLIVEQQGKSDGPLEPLRVLVADLLAWVTRVAGPVSEKASASTVFSEENLVACSGPGSGKLKSMIGTMHFATVSVLV